MDITQSPNLFSSPNYFNTCSPKIKNKYQFVGTPTNTAKTQPNHQSPAQISRLPAISTPVTSNTSTNQTSGAPNSVVLTKNKRKEERIKHSGIANIDQWKKKTNILGGHCSTSPLVELNHREYWFFMEVKFSKTQRK